MTTTCDPDHSCEVNEVFSQDRVQYHVGTMTKIPQDSQIQLWILHFLLVQDVVLTFTATLTKLFSKFYPSTGF